MLQYVPTSDRPASASKPARDFGARVYADAEELFTDENVQAVYVGTPRQVHERHAVSAACHGKHVVVEKEANELGSLARIRATRLCCAI
jgi:predicted dehydrogenase